MLLTQVFLSVVKCGIMKYSVAVRIARGNNMDGSTNIIMRKISQKKKSI